jgi:hypothetical protein
MENNLLIYRANILKKKLGNIVYYPTFWQILFNYHQSLDQGLFFMPT